jgi:hypothetical protein
VKFKMTKVHHANIAKGSTHNKRSQITCWLLWKLHLYYFEKSPIIIYYELFVHILEFCLFIHEIDSLQIWSHFIMLLEPFVIHKTLVGRVLLRTIKFECVFCYSNVHQMFSILLWALIYFIRKATCVYFLKCICIESFEWMLLISILNVLYGLKGSKFVTMVKNRSVYLIII